ncbi:hypothetical protein NEUTE1DRAFT_121198 [Neurospora tetrasperma FGSC 2508]|uniref:Uncharacterized protein n=1 Tax=Neurospora tetrasperma (strain FGSC 2508 / ATCC MYA-4615 / P0657) TaxID=510951 RepID=F8MG53_NEUT8|nr:uncharacterized protein NEUTE1DRAFT_121198 [Neurospora tetrasperma FGSC 2508]EGO59379.1 hypothetical protein NEUTE1DRAFT_121198 [Neurospora tetrasperma FGSC 2508]EGZ73503.1 hypothetical protein NEUTE2DRAFT_156962 [Neurospora tetrasperma FGSC 2509]
MALFGFGNPKRVSISRRALETVPSQSQPDAWNDWQGLNERTLPREGIQVTHATCDRDLRFRVKPWKAMALGWNSFTRGRKSVGQARRRRCQHRIVLQD